MTDIFASSVRAIGIGYAAAADALGISLAHLRGAMQDRGAPGYRRPPDDWPDTLRRLAIARSQEMTALADSLRHVQVEPAPKRGPKPRLQATKEAQP